MRKSVKIAVTGAAGQIGYAFLPCLAAGEVFGPEVKIDLHLLEITPALPALEGVVMELYDCRLPLLNNIVVTDDPKIAFDGVEWALLIGSKPRGRGVRRADLARVNGPIFVEQGKTLASRAADNVRVVVVGNPANTNCLIAYRNAQDIPADRFAALTRLDENRACAQLALKAGVHFEKITNMTVWGNHSDTQYPDAENAKINGKPAFEIIKDIEWLRGDFIETVQHRGTAIIAARGLSSAASAANAIKDHIKSFENKTPEADWFSAAIPSDGSYGVDEGLVFSYPLTNDGQGNISIVQDLPLNDFAQEKIALTHQELRDLKEIVKDLLP